MNSLAHQRCFNHAAREAVARCPSCRRFFCRECVTEHDDRILCTSCLKSLAKPPSAKRQTFATFLRCVECAAGLLVAWFFFFLIGKTLVQLPEAFHEGTIWQVPWIRR
jgi:hypothetical protein